MVWSHPDISLDDLMQLIKGFIDILILASGYQSSGAYASWDCDNIKKAVRWGMFFEEIFRRFQDTNGCSDSIQELDAAILRITSDPCFPKGLAHISSTTLANGRDFVLRHLFQNIRLKETHLNTLIVAIVELDLEAGTKSSHESHDTMNSYLENLVVEIERLNLAPRNLNFMKNHINMHKRDNDFSAEGRSCSAPQKAEPVDVKHNCNSTVIIKEILQRHSAVLCLSSANGSLNSLKEVVVNSMANFESPIEMQPCDMTSPKKVETLNVRFSWSQWRSKSLSYLLDSKTIRLLSSSELIFSASKDQWIRILNPLRNSAGTHIDNLLEIIELVLLALISRRWKRLIEHIISYSFEQLIPEHCTMHDLLLRICLNPPCVTPKENDLLEYLMDLLGSETCLLWRVHPVLVAASVSLSSVLSKLYLRDLERNLIDGSISTRCYSSKDDGNDDTACDTSERIWCLYLISCHNSHPTVYP